AEIEDEIRAKAPVVLNESSPLIELGVVVRRSERGVDRCRIVRHGIGQRLILELRVLRRQLVPRAAHPAESQFDEMTLDTTTDFLVVAPGMVMQVEDLGIGAADD